MDLMELTIIGCIPEFFLYLVTFILLGLLQQFCKHLIFPIGLAFLILIIITDP